MGKPAPNLFCGPFYCSHGFGENYRSEWTWTPAPCPRGVGPGVGPRVGRCSIQIRVFFLKRKEQDRSPPGTAEKDGGAGWASVRAQTFWYRQDCSVLSTPPASQQSCNLAAPQRPGSDLGISFPTYLGKFFESCSINKQGGVWKTSMAPRTVDWKSNSKAKSAGERAARDPEDFQ